MNYFKYFSMSDEHSSEYLIYTIMFMRDFITSVGHGLLSNIQSALKLSWPSGILILKI